MIKGNPPLTDRKLIPLPVSQWTAGLGLILREAPLIPHRLKTVLPLEIRKAGLCIWVILTLDRGIKAALRVPFDPAGLRNVRVTASTDSVVEMTADGGFGNYHIRLEALESPGTMLRFTTTLKPACELKIQSLPRDMCVLTGRLEPWAGPGRLYTVQKGNTAPQAFFSVPGRPGGTIFYFQNFTALDAYFTHTGAKRADTVTVQWPEVGFALPSGEKPMAKGRPVVIRDAFVEVRQGLPATEGRAAEIFLNALGRLYPLLPQPEAPFYDWPAVALKSLRALTDAQACGRAIEGRFYLNAYADSDYKPPESMVQVALAVPLAEYQQWRRQAVPLLKHLSHVPGSFFHARLKTVLRWLPGAEFKKEVPSEEEVRFRTDSWYLLHTMMNFGRLAEMGDVSARKVFLASVRSVIRTAQHFNYDWPVFYDQRDLKVGKQETQPGAGGERDAGGLYVDVLLRAYSMTHEAEYLAEAERAAERLSGMAFGILYQANNTVLGAVALARLWRITGKSLYRELSFVAVASLLSHLWLWNGRGVRTFMALPPLHDAPYVALYEEAEIAAALQAWQQEMAADIPEGATLLIAEYQKHLLARARFYYPDELQPAELAPEPKEGRMHVKLAVPLEGLGPPGEPAGTVGQAVYAAAAPFVFTTRCWHRLPGAPFEFYCNYPPLHMEYGGTAASGRIRIRLGGAVALRCELRLRFLRKTVEVDLLTEDGEQFPWLAKERKTWRALLQGGHTVHLAWGGAARQGMLQNPRLNE